MRGVPRVLIHRYIRKPYRRFSTSSSGYVVVAEERVEACALRCTNDLACKSFGHFSSSGGSNADRSDKECVLTYDTSETRFEPLITVKNKVDVVYEKLADKSAFCVDKQQTTFASSTRPGTPATCGELRQIGGCFHSDHGGTIAGQCPRTCETCVPLSLPATTADAAFNKNSGQFLEFKLSGVVDSNTTDVDAPAEERRANEFTSVETCAQICLHDPDCKSFEVGHGGRAGECFTSKYRKTGTVGVQLATAPFAEVDHYELESAYVPCGAGKVSLTGRKHKVHDAAQYTSACVECPVDTYSAPAASSSCSACPVGKHTESVGTPSRAGCVVASCPAAAAGPNEDGDCMCINSDCIDADAGAAASSNCRLSAGGGSVFNVGCSRCKCVAAEVAAQIKAVTSPGRNAAWPIGSTQTITYTYTAGVEYVYIALYKEVISNSNNLAAITSVDPAASATGEYAWTVPDLQPSHGYYIIVYQRAGSQLVGMHSASGRFEIIVDGAAPCPPGEINVNTGRRPCTLCEVGTYSSSDKQCSSCPYNSTTTTHGAQSVDDCNVNSTNPVYAFHPIPRHFISGANAGGVFLESHEEMTVEACAQLCLDDAGCKSFDAGVVGMFQEGDCFLSYDNRASAPEGTFKPVDQLDYYERKDSNSILPEFTKTEDCFIVGHDNGGNFDSVHTPEACGQLCLNDPCCTSFEVGHEGSLNALDCRLSYATIDSVGTKKVTCGKDHAMHLFQKTPSISFHFKSAVFAETIKTDRDQESFEAFVKAAFEKAGVSGTVESATIAANAVGTIDCRVVLSTIQGKQDAQSVLDGADGLVFWWPVAIHGFGVEYVGSFRGGGVALTSASASARKQGPCHPGTVSQTGAHPLCRTCRANTFSNPASTQCRPCPGGTTSIPGASSVAECIQTVIGDSPALFSVGDNWLGTYSVDPDNYDPADLNNMVPSLSGALHLAVTSIVGNEIQFLLGVYHGEACRPPCSTARDEQLSEYYVVGKPSGAVMTLAVDTTGPNYGWAGITDRNFIRTGLFGIVEKDSATGGTFSFSGLFGNRIFKVSRACSTHRQGEADMLVPGDTFVGWSHCNRNQNVDGTDAIDGEEDVRRLQMKISDFHSSTGAVTGTVMFENAEGRGFEYGVSGRFSPLSGCRSLSVSPRNQSAWTMKPPFGVRSRQLSGRLSDDGVTFAGEWNVNPQCECIGSSPTGAGGAGAACGYHGKSEQWCFVTPNCPEGVNGLYGPQGWIAAPCAPMPACPRFTMTRVCSATQSCPHGWEMFAKTAKCYKAFNNNLGFDDAQAACSALQATLPSVSSVEEATLLLHMAAKRQFADANDAANDGDADYADDDQAFNATSMALPNIWIGLMTNATKAAAIIAAGGTHEPVWVDGTVVGSDLDTITIVSSPGSRRNPVNCGTLGVVEDASSVDTSLIVSLGKCQNRPDVVRFVCERDHLAVDTSSDAGSNPGVGELSTTTSTPDIDDVPACHEDDITTYYNANDGSCTSCTVAAECTDSETLMGTCSHAQTPRCVACHGTCKTCSGPGSTACTTCAKAWYMSLEQPGLCVQECEFGQTKVEKPRRCIKCHPDCEACSGPNEVECETCQGKSFLLPSKSNAANDDVGEGFKGAPTVAVGKCYAECPEGLYQNRGTKTCDACSECGNNQYQRRQCSGFQDTLCRDVLRCAFVPPKSDGTPASFSEYESEAPTPTSDRKCTDVTKCGKGEEQVTAATPISDSVCQKCLPGFVDHDRDGKSACTKCPPGTFTSASTTACKKCPAGTIDADSDPTTPCTPCSLENGKYMEEKGGTECSNVTSCDRGFEPINAARADEDVRCAECAQGFHKPTIGNAPCTSTPWCAPGYQPTRNASLVADWGCEMCPGGSFKPSIGSEVCKPFTVCKEGFQDFDASHQFLGSDRDQFCSPCTPGKTFSVLDGSRQSCMPVKKCGLDEYEVAAPTLSTDRECAARTLCGSNQYASVPGTATTNTECAPLSACRRDQWIVYQPDLLPVGDGRVADRICANCTVCNAGDQTLSPCTKSSDAICSGCGKTCDLAYIASEDGASVVQWGEFEVSACGTDSGDGDDLTRKCQACTPCDYSKGYAKALCSGNDDTVCAPATVCNFPTEFEVSPPQGTDDRRCALVMACGEGEGEVVAPSETRDRECSPCVAGSSFIGNQASACQKVTQCSAGFEESVPPTAVSDRQCTPCPDGTYKEASGAGVCVAWPACNTGEYEIVAGTALAAPECASCDGTSGYQDAPGAQDCKPIDDCGPGTYTWGEPSASRNRQCKPCSLGRYQPHTNAPICLEKKICGKGERMTDYGNAETDTACTLCVGPNFKEVAGNDAECMAPTDCPPGHEELVASTAMQDRICQRCADGTFSFGGGGHIKCAPFTKCLVGAFEAIAGSELSDAVCRPCPYGTFSAVPEALQCQSWSRRCSPGTFESVPPSVWRDRVCAACPAGQFQDHDGQPQCIELTMCTYGEEEVATATDRRDRTCGQCTPGTFSADENSASCTACAEGQFQNRHGQSACNVWQAPCADTFAELASPTTATDRVCSSENATASAQASGANGTASLAGDESGKKRLTRGASTAIALLVIAVVLTTVGVVYYRRKFRAADPSGDFQVSQRAMVGDDNQAREFLNPMYATSPKANLQEVSTAAGGGAASSGSFTHFPASVDPIGTRRIAQAGALASPESIGSPDAAAGYIHIHGGGGAAAGGGVHSPHGQNTNNNSTNPQKWEQWQGGTPSSSPSSSTHAAPPAYESPAQSPTSVVDIDDGEYTSTV